MSAYWEWYFIVIVAVWTVLFPAGGTELPATKTGYKWLRRFVAPTFTVPLLFLVGVSHWWQIILCCGGMCGVCTMPYGSKSTWLMRSVTFICLVLPTLFLGFSWWLLLAPLVLAGLFILSNWKPTAKSFPWVVVCAIYGAFIGASIDSAVANCWFCK